MTINPLSSTLSIPDPTQLTYSQRLAHLGPQLLFFSGGSALTAFSQQLKHFTHNSIHLVTPFDSGGSSAKLREHFCMPAVGDLRSRLLALADDDFPDGISIAHLFGYRLPCNTAQKYLQTELLTMLSGEHPRVIQISAPLRTIVLGKLSAFYANMPVSFDLRGASIGNLVLAGDYIEHGAKLESCISRFADMVQVRGRVWPVVNDNLHLGALLQNGQTVLGQHNLTGKEVPVLSSPIARIFLTDNLATGKAVDCQLGERNSRLIATANLICYPPGSFYSSLLANFLPKGVGSAIAKNNAPKVYVPNLGHDPEQLGMSLTELVKTLLSHLMGDDNSQVAANQLLNYLLIDSKNGKYCGEVPHRYLKCLGIEVIDVPLVSLRSAPYYDNQLLVEALMSLPLRQAVS
ncbi:MAG: CofD-related protein of GAK system [Paraglaciecola sp.]|jgi:CofD-related protein of GAK system